MALVRPKHAVDTKGIEPMELYDDELTASSGTPTELDIPCYIEYLTKFNPI